MKTLAQLWADAPPSLRARNASALDTQRRAACPPSERAALDASLLQRAKSVARGAASNRTGDSLHAYADAHHARALARGLAVLRRQHPAVVQRKDGRLVRSAKSGADYSGTLRGGRSVVVEVKSAGRHRLALVEPAGGAKSDASYTGLLAHQADDLTAQAELGALALIVVRFVRRPRGIDVATVYAVPWVEIAHLDDIGPDDVSAHVVSGDCYLARFVEEV